MYRGKLRTTQTVRSFTWQPRDDALGRSPGHLREAHGEGPGPRLGGLTLATAGLVVALAAIRLLSTIAVRGAGAPTGAARPDDVLLVVLAWAGVVLAAWLGLGSLLAALAALPGTVGRAAGGAAERITPSAARKVLTLVLGASVGSVALPAPPVAGAGSAPVSRAVSVGAAGSPTTGGTAGPAEGSVGGPVEGSVEGPVEGSVEGPVEAPVGGPAELGPGFTPSSSPAPTSVPGPGFAPTRTTGLRGSDDEQRARAGGSATAPTAVTPAFVATTREPSHAGQGDAGPGYVPSAPPPVLAADRTRLLAPSPRPTAGTHDVVTVHRGDSLWAVAARHLGPGAGDAQIAHEWPRWYAANRDVIGDDPDLLVPGQQLRPPAALSPSSPSVGVTAPVPARRGAHR